MSKCDSYHLEPERHYFVDEYGAPIYEIINVPRCWGTREKDVCGCDGNRSKCSFYESVRANAVEENSFLTTKNVLNKIEDLIGLYWGTDPAYYTGSENKEEADAAKLCCKILETIWLAQKGENDEKDS